MQCAWSLAKTSSDEI